MENQKESIDHHPEISQHQILTYLQNDLSVEEKQQITKIRNAVPKYDFLFDLVEQQKTKATIRTHKDVDLNVPSTFSELDKLLLRVFSNQTRPDDAQRFIDGLMFSPLFYQRLLVKLSSVTPEIAVQEVPEMAQMNLMADETVLSYVEKIAHPESATTEKGGIAVFVPEIKSWFQDIYNLGKRIPRYAYAVPVIVLLFAIILLKVPFLNRDFSLNYVFDDHVPYEYVSSSLRSGQNVFENDPEIQSFVNQFKLGISDYLVQNYAGAIHIFRNLESSALSIQDKLNSKEYMTQIRDYYFYFGLSHFALSRSQSHDLGQGERGKHSKAAIQDLSRAESLTITHSLTDKDEVAYFLGLAYGFGGEWESAVRLLKKIEPGNKFYEESIELMNQWSE